MEYKNKKIQIKKSVFILLVLVVSSVFSGCLDGQIDVSRLMEKPMDYTIPIVKNVEDRFWGEDPDLVSDYAEYYIDIDPAYGEKLRISQVEILPQLIMEAYKNADNIVDDEFKQKFTNKITVYNDSNQVELELEVTSDGTIYAREDKNSPVFRFPEYVYYAIEGSLWKIGDADADITETCNSLISPLSDWSPSMGPDLLELRLDHDIKTMLYMMYGYSDAVFVSCKIYSTLELDRQYKLYTLIAYEGYDYVDDTFWPRYGEVTPCQLIYSWVEGEFWALTEMKFADETSYNNFAEEDIRKILPFLDTQKALEDLKDITTFEDELERQALEYLSDIGKGAISVVDRK